MFELIQEQKYKNNPNYLGSFRGFYDMYSIWTLNKVLVLNYSNGNVYSNVIIEDLNGWLKSRNYKPLILKNEKEHCTNQRAII
jgi:hypothetical protein